MGARLCVSIEKEGKWEVRNYFYYGKNSFSVKHFSPGGCSRNSVRLSLSVKLVFTCLPSQHHWNQHGGSADILNSLCWDQQRLQETRWEQLIRLPLSNLTFLVLNYSNGHSSAFPVALLFLNYISVGWECSASDFALSASVAHACLAQFNEIPLIIIETNAIIHFI